MKNKIIIFLVKAKDFIIDLLFTRISYNGRFYNKFKKY